jgi:hypothetical protein
VAGQPQASGINGLDNSDESKNPAEASVNPSECPTSAIEKRVGDALADAGRTEDNPSEIERRLFEALAEAGRSALGLRVTVDTFKAMLRPLASCWCSQNRRLSACEHHQYSVSQIGDQP